MLPHSPYSNRGRLLHIFVDKFSQSSPLQTCYNGRALSGQKILSNRINPDKTVNEMAKSKQKQPNILVIWGDDIGITNLSCYSHGLMGYQTPNIDRIAKEGMMFTDAYGEQSCTAGRSSFITGQSVYRTGLSKVGMPGAPVGMNEKIVTIAALLKEEGYATGQFGKNHLGDLNHMLPTNHGFDEFFGNLYHLNAEEEPEMDNYPSKKNFHNSLKHLVRVV